VVAGSPSGRERPSPRTLSRLRRAPAYARGRAIRAFNGSAHRLETARGGGDAPLHHPPVFVVGAPRSGSTLLYQVLVQAFDVGYLSNRHCRLWGAPSVVERVRRVEPPPSFSSRFGRTSAADEPSECGPFWYRFFRRSPQYVPIEDADPDRMRQLRAAVRAFGDAAGRPLVFKNLLCTLRLVPIGRALPEAVFVDIRRDLEANAASLLAARREIHGDYATWWSAEPPEIAELRSLSPVAQVVEQVRRLEALVDRDRSVLGADRFLQVGFEDLCDDPERVLAAVAELTERHAFSLARRQAIPAKFDRPGATPLDPEIRDRLVEHIHEL
jgi:Sulfotransferase family